MEIRPYKAPVGSPLEEEKSGSAWYARWIIACESRMTSRLGFSVFTSDFFLAIVCDDTPVGRKSENPVRRSHQRRAAPYALSSLRPGCGADGNTSIFGSMFDFESDRVAASSIIMSHRPYRKSTVRCCTSGSSTARAYACPHAYALVAKVASCVPKSNSWLNALR